MIDYLDNFFDHSTKSICVGGVVGTQIEKMSIEAATRTTPFTKILVINGCQDYIGIAKSPIKNVLYWADLFTDEIVDPIEPYDSWRPKIFNPKVEFISKINTELLSHYDVLIVLNASLIPGEHIKQIDENFGGKIVYVFDPIEASVGSLRYIMGVHDMPVIVDSLEKTSPMVAFARSLINVDTRAIDRKVKGTLNTIPKMSKRSIGKIDDKQYITNNPDLMSEIQAKQYQAPFRKHQKVWVKTSRFEPMLENGARKATVTYGSMLVIENANKSPLMLSRLYNSKIIFAGDLKYERDSTYDHFLNNSSTIPVEPANIISLYQAQHHRFNHAVFINAPHEYAYHVTKRSLYIIIKNSNNVTLVGNFDNIRE